MSLMCTSMAVNLARGYTFNAVFNAAVAFAVAAVPVQLPMVVTTILARGTRVLAGAVERPRKKCSNSAAIRLVPPSTQNRR